MVAYIFIFKDSDFAAKERYFACDRLLDYVISLSKAKVVFVATDKNPMVSDIEEHFKKKKVLTYGSGFAADLFFISFFLIKQLVIFWVSEMTF